MYVASLSDEETNIQQVERKGEVSIDSNPEWMPQSHDLLYIAEQKTRRPLVRISDVGEGKQGDTTEVIANNLVCWDFNIADQSKEVVALAGSMNKLTSIVLASKNPNDVKVIANPNKHTDRWLLPLLSVVKWKAPDGTEIEGVLEIPSGHERHDGPLPMYVNLHGGPTSAETSSLEFSMYGRGLLSSQGWAVFSPNYRGSTGYGDAFLTDLIGRENDIEVQDILAGVDAMVKRGIADPNRLAVGGWSNGGYLTNCLITKTSRFKAASSGAGVFSQTMQWSIEDTPGHVVNYAKGLPWSVPEELQEMSPIFEADNIATPTIIHVGAGDERVPAEQSKALYRALHDYLDVPTQLIIYPGTGHGISKMSHRRAKIEWDAAWLQRWVLDQDEEH
jgi:dipeptidyl aminopeptidase/acylaminoacyl peptidase